MDVARLRQSAREIWEAAIHAANPSTCIRNSIRRSGGKIRVGGQEVSAAGRVIVLGAGKATARMAQVFEEILGDRITAGLIVTKHGYGLPLERIRLVEAGHPIPDEAGVQAVGDMRRLLAGLKADDLVVCLMSGGGSALWPAPAPGITLEEKQQVTSLLMRAGAGIRELNAVRKHLSEVKGGQLARWAAPARVVSLIMSDVIGDPLDFIASGPTAPDTTSFADALGIVQKYGISAPPPVLKRLMDGAGGAIPDTPKAGDPLFQRVANVIIANNTLLVEAACQKASALGLKTRILGTGLEGEARDVAQMFAATAREAGRSRGPEQEPACILAAGETTVTVRGDGVGGRNQEMALAWAMEMSGYTGAPCCFASVATDGTDGPTDAAGGLVDPTTCARGAGLGLIAADYLRRNDSWHFLKGVGDLIVTGPTLTNLMDLQILLVGA
jgi:hydroxypyruvate reductase